MPPKKKGGKKGGKAAADWGSDDDLVVDPLAAAAATTTTTTADSDEDDASAAPAPVAAARQNKKQNKKKTSAAAAAAFALLADDDDDDGDEGGESDGSDAAAADDDEEAERSPSPPRRAPAAASFAALGLDDEGADDDDDEEESEEEEPSSSSLLVAAKVLSIERHPDADKLSVLCLDAGTASGEGEDSNKQGRPRRVVTNAAEQLEAGDTVVLALPGATLPGGSKVQVSKATVRGVASEGMLCSGADLCWCSVSSDDKDSSASSAASTVPARLEETTKAFPPGSRVPAGPGVSPPAGAVFGAAADRVAAKEKKKAKKAAAAAAAAAALAALDSSVADASSESLDLDAAKKKKKKKSTADFGAALAALEAGGGAEEANGGGDAPAAPAADAADDSSSSSSKKPKKKKSTADLDALMAQIEGGDGDGGGDEKEKKEKKKKKDKKEAYEPSPSSVAAAAAPAPPATAMEEKKKGPEATGDPEIDALLFNIENPSSGGGGGGGGGSAAASKKAKKKAKKAAAAGAGAAAEVDDLDAALAELGLDKPSKEAPAAPPPPSSSAPDAAGEDADDDSAAAAAGAGGEPKELSAAQKKKLKKKAKEKAAKSGDGGGGGGGEADAAAAAAAAAEEEEAAAASAASKKGAKPGKGPSAAVRRLQEELEARKRAEAEAAAAEAARVAEEEAEIAAQEAEEARKAADAEARRQRQKERRAELKKQGLLLTGKAKKEAERLAAVREQFLKSSGGAAGAAGGDDGGDDGEKRPKKAVYEKKKKSPKSGASLSSAPSSVPSEAAEVAAEEEEAAAAAREKAEEEAKAKAAAADAAAAAAATEAEAKRESEEEDAADAWDELDLDEVVLPVKKSKIDDEEASSSSSEDDEGAVAAKAAKQPVSVVAAAAKKKPAVLTAAEKKKAADAKAAAAKAAAAAAAAARLKKAVNGGTKAAAAAKASSDDDEDDEDDEDATSSSEEEEEDETDSDDESDDSDDDSDSSDDSEEARERLLDASKRRRALRWDLAKSNADSNRLRSPICCILGHVDTGKTKLLDNVRRTSVQEGEAGGITQQIGATYIPADAVVKRTAPLREGGGKGGGGEVEAAAAAAASQSQSSTSSSSEEKIDLCAPLDLRLPGLLVIDTPGHESFSNLRSRGSGLCDVAVLVVDLMHGLEPQTIESINLLKSRKTPFIVALNKVDRLFDWKPLPDGAMRTSLQSQQHHVKSQFDKQVAAATLALNEQGLNVALYWENPDPRRYVSLVPTSAITGEGVPDLLHVLSTVAQSRRLMGDRLVFVDEPQVSVLEVKVIEGLGTTVDVVLVNGRLKEGDTVVACGLGGPLVATVRSLLTPHPLKELRVKGSYQHHKEVEGAQGVKICAHGLESAVAGTALLVASAPTSIHQTPPAGGFDDVEALKLEAMEDMHDIFASVDRSGEGVCAQASTLGSLEALLEFLRSEAVQIPVTGIAIGPVHKRDVMRASVMLEKGQKKYAAILAFDVPVTREARELAEELGVRVFTADIIYHLFDQFTEYMKLARREEAEAAKAHAAFPCVLKILPTCVFNKRDPIVLGVEVEEGTAAVGTPLCVPTQGGFELGRIASLELNHKAVDRAHRGDSVAMKIEATNATEAARLYGRHFDHNDRLVSKLTRKSIDVLKEHFREDLGRDDWILVVKLKKLFGIE